MVKVTELSEQEISEIGEAFADYAYADGEKGMSYIFDSRDKLKDYICGFARAMLAAGLLYSTSENHEAFVAYRYSKDKMKASAGFVLIKEVLKTLGPGGAFRMLKAMSSGGPSYEDTFKKTKKPYIFVGMVVVRRKYQGQGYMRKVMDIAFAEGDRLRVPVILETDAKSKCDKYVHLGMQLAGIRDIGEFGKLYDMIKYPRTENS